MANAWVVANKAGISCSSFTARLKMRVEKYVKPCFGQIGQSTVKWMSSFENVN